MKKTLIILFACAIALAPGLIYAQEGVNEPGTGLAEPELKATTQGTGRGLLTPQPAVINEEMPVATQAVQQRLRDQSQIETVGVTETGALIQPRGVGNRGDLAEPVLEPTRQGQENGRGVVLEGQGLNDRALDRRSRVANSVQTMEKIADRNKGVGDRVRVIAQNQNQMQEEAETALGNAQKRGGVARFFIGPNYGQLKDASDRLETHTASLTELRALRSDLAVSSDRTLLDEQILAMEEVKDELETEIANDKKGFSLFGWLSRLISE